MIITITTRVITGMIPMIMGMRIAAPTAKRPPILEEHLPSGLA